VRDINCLPAAMSAAQTGQGVRSRAGLPTREEENWALGHRSALMMRINAAFAEALAFATNESWVSL